MNVEDTISAAREYLQQGCSPIPVPRSSKAPSRSKWNEYRASLETIPRDFRRDGNIGLLLGDPSNGLIDIDLDCDVAIKLAPHWLPETDWVHGRPTKPSSHFWYRCDRNMRPRKYSDLSGNCMLEIRSTGQHTLVPPSVHPGGEKLTWHRSKSPTTVTTDALTHAVNCLAACCLVARHWPSEGSRQDCALALAGSLLRGGFSIDDAERFIELTAQTAGDEEWARRKCVVSSTASRLAAGGRVKSLPTLENLLGQDVADRLVQWLDLRKVPAQANEPTPKSNAATRLLKMMDKAVLFASEDGKSFASVPVGEHSENYPIASSAFARFLRKSFFEFEGTAISSTALKDATDVLEARAQFSGVRQPTSIRVGGDDETVYLDLGNDQWNAVRVDADGWSIIDNPPVSFWRSPGMQPLPEPNRGGQLESLHQVLNIDSEANWQLLLAWLIGALRPRGPYPILIITGQAGSAKSTTAELLRQSIDPAMPRLRSLPKAERDLMIGANSNWISAFDNLSGMPAVTSDILCRLSTGGGYAKRALYSNDEETLFCLQRPIILTSIDEVATREDLLDRAIVLSLGAIPATARLDEQTLWKNFNQIHPYLLGNLLDACSASIRNYQSVKLESRPRLADFARWATAAEPSLELPTGSVIAALTSNRAAAFAAGIDADVVASELIAFMAGRDQWSGTASQLLDDLSKNAPDRLTRQRTWPNNATQMGNRLRRVLNILEHNGLSVVFQRQANTTRARLIVIENAQPTVHSVHRAPLTDRRAAAPAQVDGMDTLDNRTTKPGGTLPGILSGSVADGISVPSAAEDRNNLHPKARSLWHRLYRRIGTP